MGTLHMDAASLGPAARPTGSQASFRVESGLSYEGARFGGSGGHPNSWVMSNRMGKMSNGAHTYDRDPLKDRLSRIARFDGISSIVGQMMSNPQNERVQRLGCFSLAEVSYRNWDYTIKSAITRGAAAVVMAMQNHPDSAGLQHWGCAALASMSQGSEDGRRIVVHEGGAAVVAS